MIEGGDRQWVKMQLEDSGIEVIKLKKKPIDLLPKRIKGRDITLFVRQLSTMSMAGVPLVRGLDTMIETVEKHDALRRLIHDIKQSVESGNALSETLRNYPKYFDHIFVRLVAVGERSGTLDILLQRIAIQRESASMIKKKVKKALMYPLTVLIISVMVTAVLLAFAIPAFANIFKSSGMELPQITQYTIYASDMIIDYWWLFILVAILLVILMQQARKRFWRFYYFIDSLMLRLPILGHLIKQSILARFTRTLEITLRAGMPLYDALDVVAPSLGNSQYEKSVWKLRAEISSGKSLAQAIKQAGMFPALLVQMIAIGEQSGKLEDMLGNVAGIYEHEVDDLVSMLSSMMEPVIMLVLGGIVGFLVVSMYVPMFSMGNAF
ncbi:MAG: type II secretion system F family protein [Francisellaceae bacterium]